MKKILNIAALFLLAFQLNAQENMVTVSGGYSFSKIEDTDVTATGFRINGLYEFNPLSAKFAHGVSFGYINISASETVLLNEYTYTVNSFPLYYAPKYMFGNDKIKAFVKGAVGLQFAYLKTENSNGGSLSDNDLGFYGGGGGGIMYFIKDNIFINAEYEIAWASNQWYKDGWMNSAMGGIGIKF